ncbi:AAA family ATPase [Mycolicibacterium fortuitum]|uniref:phosphatase domain-containing protein n=1 Tax=Mycolicibacterium fortuitum TaxID=1766 RepID=UPI00260BBEAF|nr:AAA family ATPase [Mycolicibacterium fortuitum]
MTNPTLTCMRGYPGSGKSTRARELAEATGAVVVCRDDLRNMLHGTYWTGIDELEQQVTIAEAAQVGALLAAGTSVVVDATHLRGRALQNWAKVAAKHGADFAVEDMLTDADTCAHRDLTRKINGDRSVGRQVIEDMAKRWPIDRWPTVTARAPFRPEPVTVEKGLPWAVLVDIDGTLAHMTDRSPYDYTKVSTDERDEQITWLVRVLYDLRFGGFGPNIIVMSGRPDTCRDDTATWLKAWGTYYDELHMRPAGAVDDHGNQLPDYIVKHDLYNQHIRGKYNVRFVLDDRQQVVDLWRAMGLKCLQVAPGDF